MTDIAGRPQETQAGPGWSGKGISVTPLPAMKRWALRVRPERAEAAGAALGIPLPLAPCSSARQAGRAVLWLGPDEWLILDADPDAPAPVLEGAHALVDLSHRNVGFELSGPEVEAVLSHGCPLDLRAFAVGKCARTLFGKVEILLWRTQAQTFRIEFWRSYTDYVTTMLTRSALGTM